MTIHAKDCPRILRDSRVHGRVTLVAIKIKGTSSDFLELKTERFEFLPDGEHVWIETFGQDRCELLESTLMQFACHYLNPLTSKEP